MLEMWFLSEKMDKKVEGAHTGFLVQITGKQVWIVDGAWEMHGAEVVQKASGTQSAMTYIGRRQASVAQWVTLQTILKVCAGGEG